MGANSLSFLKLAALCALLASCAGLSAPLGEHENKVDTTSRFLEEAGSSGSEGSWVESEEHESKAEEAEHDDEEEGAIKFGFVLGLMALAGTFIFGYILEHHEINWLPEAGVGVLMGVLASGITTYGGFKMVKAHEQFDFEFFMVFLLPPIIFDAGYNMDVKSCTRRRTRRVRVRVACDL